MSEFEYVFVLRGPLPEEFPAQQEELAELILDLCDEIVLLSHGKLERVEKSELDRGDFKERNMVRWCVSAVILAAAYGLPMAGYILPGEVSLGLLLAMILLGLLGIPKILRFKSYRQLNQQVLAQFFDGMDAVTHQAQTNTHHLISESSEITSHKRGFEYLDDLFVKRHRRLLWKATWIISGVCGVLVLAGAAGLMLFPAIRPKVQFVILNTLPF